MTTAPKSLTDAQRWQAVLARDARHDADFVYGVTSTRIFCRASCPSRRPQPERARFFSGPREAASAGFRPCKRCRPEDENATLQTVRRACQLISEASGAPLSLLQLGRAVGVSPHHLQRLFKAATGVSPREYGEALRLKRLKSELHDGASVLGAGLEAGFASSRGVYERAAAQLGMTPATYGKGGSGAHIGFTTAPCALGFVLVAQTARGVCAVTLGDDAVLLETALHRDFFAAEIARDDARLHHALNAVLRHLEGEPGLELPLDVRATAFQWRVWRELQNIARGSTRSYAQIAAQLGQPTAARAVAGACASNPVALVVPCHRVVREDGALSGYRWGIERKRALLKREGALPAE